MKNIIVAVLITLLLFLGVYICAYFLATRDSAEIIISGYGCEVTATAKAWLDENENGVWDTNEVPLSGVNFSMSPGASATTDEAGLVHLESGEYGFEWTSGKSQTSDFCEIDIWVHATVPEGYRLTTPSKLSAWPSGQTLQFGFILAPDS